LCIDARLRRFSVMPPPTTAFYPISLHDALPICLCNTFEPISVTPEVANYSEAVVVHMNQLMASHGNHCVPLWHSYTYRAYSSFRDRKSTRLNSSHVSISYAVFCLQTTKVLARAT